MLSLKKNLQKTIYHFKEIQVEAEVKVKKF